MAEAGVIHCGSYMSNHSAIYTKVWVEKLNFCTENFTNHRKATWNNASEVAKSSYKETLKSNLEKISVQGVYSAITFIVGTIATKLKNIRLICSNLLKLQPNFVFLQLMVLAKRNKVSFLAGKNLCPLMHQKISSGIMFGCPKVNPSGVMSLNVWKTVRKSINMRLDAWKGVMM